MAWGSAAQQGVADLCARLARDDPGLRSLTLLRARRFNAADAEQLFSALRGNTQLRELSTSSHPLTCEAAALLSAALLSQPDGFLQRLCVGDRTFGDAGLAALTPGCARLRSLALDGRGLTHASGAVLARLLSGPLAELTLADNSLGDDGVALLLSCGSEALETLDLSRCSLSSASGAPLASLLSACSRLASLRLAGNSLGGAGARSLCSGGLSTSLRQLDLCDCAIGDDGAAALAEALSSHAPQLQALQLAHCGLGARGVAALAASAAQRVSPLRELCLAGNAELGCAPREEVLGATRLLSACGVQWLDLGQCGLSGDAIAPLFQQPEGAHSLRRLALFANPLGRAGAESVARSLAGSQLERLDLSATQLCAHSVALLCAALEGGGGERLELLEIGANEGASADAALQAGSEPEWRWENALRALREKRPEMDVAWRAGDAQRSAEERAAIETKSVSH
jgi:hypothetical protein